VQTRREEALELTQDILSDVEGALIPPRQIALKAQRLATLLDDSLALEWLRAETTGYKGLEAFDAIEIAEIVGRINTLSDSTNSFTFASLTRLARYVEECYRREDQENELLATDLIDAVTARIHRFASEKYLELRFGNAAETAFERVRAQVDAQIARLAPEAALKFAAAFEGADSDDSERWAQSVTTCRRLIKAVADRLQPAGPPINNREMTDPKYINRLAVWIEARETSKTRRTVAQADLESLGKRIYAFDKAGSKGVHAEVDQDEATRFITGTYLLMGDILALDPETVTSTSQRALENSMRFLELDRDVTDADIAALDDGLND